MIHLNDAETGASIGTISEEQLQFLIDHFEEESEADRDYYIDEATLEMLEEAGADESLLSFLRKALAGKDGIEIRWSRDAEE